MSSKTKSMVQEYLRVFLATSLALFLADGYTAGNGGNGLANSISGSSVYYAGGGGGGTAFGSAGSNGLGGGSSSYGGGGLGAGTSGTSGSGGQGIVIIRYLTNS
jgi:hypothetical protein